MPNYLMALDQGTTSSRCILFDESGRIVASAAHEFPQYFPREGWVEHDPMEIWSSQIGVASEALLKTGATWRSVRAIGITNQRETTIVWDRKTGVPVYSAIVWQCRRTAPRCDELRAAGLAETIRKKTGLLPDPYFSATKLEWIFRNVPGTLERAKRGELCFGTVDSWLLWKLTGGRVHATDVTNASRTMLFNIHTLSWDDELLDLFGIPRAILPTVLPSSGLFGYAAPDVLGAGIPITGMAGDQQAALFGEGCHTPGSLKNTYGTGGFLLMNTGDKPIEQNMGLVSTVAWQIGDKVNYALEGSVFVCGSAVQWLRDQLGLIKTAAETEKLARKVEDTGGVYLVPAFTGMGAPYWDPTARGVLIGITRATNRNHVVRATLEAMAYQTAEMIALMESVTGEKIPELKVDGGASANRFLLEFQADVSGIPVVRPSCIESTAFGAAALAGIGVGLYRSENDVAALISEDTRIKPKKDAAWREEKKHAWKRAVKRALAWADAED
ncbi:MAG: glycerol kinase GlpK [Clostridia bacterium]|nr:glycerol kinase GlpK [Clostridia bacterium]